MAEKTPQADADRPVSPTAKKSTVYTYSRLRDDARALGFAAYELAGAARFHGWSDDTELTKDQLRKGVEDWLKSPVPTRAEEA